MSTTVQSLFFNSVSKYLCLLVLQMDPTHTHWNCVFPPRLIYKGCRAQTERYRLLMCDSDGSKTQQNHGEPHCRLATWTMVMLRWSVKEMERAKEQTDQRVWPAGNQWKHLRVCLPLSGTWRENLTCCWSSVLESGFYLNVDLTSLTVTHAHALRIFPVKTPDKSIVLLNITVRV